MLTPVSILSNIINIALIRTLTKLELHRQVFVAHVLHRVLKRVHTHLAGGREAAEVSGVAAAAAVKAAAQRGGQAGRQTSTPGQLAGASMLIL